MNKVTKGERKEDVVSEVISLVKKIESNSNPVKSIKVEARGEAFRIVQLQGNLFVCSKAHGNCCCGWTEKGRAPVNLDLYSQEWENRRIRNKVHLSFAGCLGPCAVGNSALLLLAGRSIWFKDLNDDKFIPLIFDYVEALLKDPNTQPIAELAEHVYERYLPAPPIATTMATITIGSEGVETVEEDVAELERLDPVCLMEVDPATARFQT